MLVTFTVAWFFTKQFYFRELSKIGYVEKLLSVEANLKNFKEVIRKEVCEQIVKGMTIIFREEDVYREGNSRDSSGSAENFKKPNIIKVKDAVLNLVKKTKARLTTVDIKNRQIKRRVDLIENNQITKESRTKRSFSLGDYQTS
jgi:hypothetical protein